VTLDYCALYKYSYLLTYLLTYSPGGQHRRDAAAARFSSSRFVTVRMRTRVTMTTMTSELPARPSSVLLHQEVRYDTRCYFNVRSKADVSQLNLPHGNRQLKRGKQEN